MTARLQDRRYTLDGIPVRLVHRDSPERAGVRGTVLVHHGLGGSIDGQTKELVTLAERGFLAVGVDNVGHGARAWPDLEARLSGPGVEEEFLGAVYDTAAELPRLVDALLARGWAHESGLGQTGISMGGFVSYRARLEEPRLVALCPVLGTPRWKRFEDLEPARFAEAFAPVALLAQNAGADVNVPPEDAREFHEMLRPLYLAHPERLDYVEFPDCEHFMPEDEWNRLWANVLDWFERFLTPR